MNSFRRTPEDPINYLSTLSVTDFATLTETLEGRKHAAAALAAEGGGAVAPAPVADGRTGFTVVLTEKGNKAIELIAVVREITGVGLSEAKDLVHDAPSHITRNVSRAEADDIAARLTGAGAEVEVTCS